MIMPWQNTKFLRLCLLLLVFTSKILLAQPQSGAIVGVVTDSEGRGIPNISISIFGSTLTASGVSTTTNQNGEYRFPTLPPGEYKVDFFLGGFQHLIREGIKVQVGKTFALNTELNLAPVQETTIVRGSPLIDVRSNNIGTHYSTKDLENLPTARDVWSVLEEAPSMVSRNFNVGGNESGLQTVFNARGGSWSQNTHSLDGIDITQPGFTGVAQFYIDYDTIEELQASTTAHSAEVLSPGVSLNVITKSGSNNFHGGAKFFFENSDMQSSNLASDLVAIAGFGEKIDSFTDFHAELGGPILRNKIWFYGAFRDHRIDRFMPGFPIAESTEIQYGLFKGTVFVGQNHRLQF